MKVSVRDPEKIPQDRIFEMEQQLYLVSFEVEEVPLGDGSEDGGMIQMIYQILMAWVMILLIKQTKRSNRRAMWIWTKAPVSQP